jgi:uncharacterized membrane protein
MATVAHRGFVIGVIWKGIEGLFELGMAIALNFVRLETLRGTLVGYSLNHLAYDPTDWFASHLLHVAQSISLSQKIFTTLYLFAHGVLRLFMFTTLIQRLRWSFPVSIVLLLLFFLYQVVHLIQHFSVGFALLATVDPTLAVLVYVEHRRIFPGQPLWSIFGARETSPG